MRETPDTRGDANSRADLRSARPKQQRERERTIKRVARKNSRPAIFTLQAMRVVRGDATRKRIARIKQRSCSNN